MKFKIGDTVRVTKALFNSDDKYFGKVGKIISAYDVSDGKAWDVKFKKLGDLYMYEEQLELVKPKKATKGTVKEKKKPVEEFKPLMHLEISHPTILIKAVEGDRYLELEFKGEECVRSDSNLPYKKTKSDWEFFGKALEKILKEV